MLSESALHAALEIMRGAELPTREAYVEALREFCTPDETVLAYVEAFVAKAILDDRRRVGEACATRGVTEVDEPGGAHREIEALKSHLERLTAARMRSLEYGQRLEEQLLAADAEVVGAEKLLAQVIAALESQRNALASSTGAGPGPSA
jgi:hypothetical protein